MKSPFPGMDRYLERPWRDVNHRLFIYACDATQPALLARIQHCPVVESDTFERSVYPDVSIVDEVTRGLIVGGMSALELAEPMREAK